MFIVWDDVNFGWFFVIFDLFNFLVFGMSYKVMKFNVVYFVELMREVYFY